MNLEESLCAHLKAYAGLAALVSTRVYPLQLPQSSTLPTVVYRRIDGPRVEMFGAASAFQTPRFQVDAWGATYASAKGAAAQVQAALGGFMGLLGGAGGVNCTALLVNDVDLPDPETGWVHVASDFVIWVNG